MTSAQWQRVKAIVSEAWSAEPAARADLVAQACAGEEEIRREVSSLLDAIEQAGDRFEQPAAAGFGGPLLAALGRPIGPYEIRRELGRGGMGAVFLATRTDSEFAREVAVKIIKRGMDTDAIVGRFRTERQILAGLNHPNIARLLDGGSTADGLPYLVMEYVEGEPITAYCDAHRLTVNERLLLFRKVCAAVAYAHQRLVVHRDIKPSNVLVSSDGEPKLLDFGLAKILDPGIAAPETETVNRWMTPEFASPEQVRGERVTTVTDVYSLGVLLYELLSGRRPFGHLRTGGPELLRAICEEDAEKPSAALARLPAEVSAARATAPERLRRTLRGDLDNIVLKAIDRDPSRRYPGAQEFAEDIRRYLEHLPVTARRDTFGYHAATFVRRHKAATIAAAAVAATLVGATAVTTAQARIARREREQAERHFREVRQLASSFLFEFHDAIATLPGSTAAREMVVRKAQEYLSSLAQEAGSDRQLWLELSTAYVKLGDVQGRPSASRTGDTEGALASYRQALEMRRRLAALEPSNPEFAHDVAIALVRIGPVSQVRGDPRAAVDYTREAMQIMDRLMATAPSAEVRRDGFRAPLYLGDALYDLGDYDGALAMFQKALAVAETARLDPPEADFRHRLAVARERLGIMFMVKGDAERALESHREALANEEAMMASAPDNTDYIRMAANGHYYVGDALRGLRRREEALASEERALAMYEGLANADPLNAGPKKDLAGCLEKMAEIRLDEGDHADARRLLARAASIRRDLAAHDGGSIEDEDDLAGSLTLWGEALLAARDTQEAIARLDQARAIREPLVRSRPQQAVYGRGLARVYLDLGDAHASRAARSTRRADAKNRWSEARRLYSQGLSLWIGLRDRRALWANETGRPEEIALRLSACDRALQSR